MNIGDTIEHLAMLESQIKQIKQCMEPLSMKTDDSLLTLKDGALFIQLMAFYTTQRKSAYFEKYVIEKLTAERINASESSGDFRYQQHAFEMKTTYSESHLNIRQLRLWQPVHYVVWHIDEKEPINSKVFTLTHQQMRQEAELMEASYTHGTKLVNEKQVYRELSLTLAVGSAHYRRWEELYVNEALKKRIIK